jgi:hypothetical protein
MKLKRVIIRHIPLGRLTLSVLLYVISCTSQAVSKVPKVYAHAIAQQGNTLVLTDPDSGKTYPLRAEKPLYRLAQFSQAANGTKKGLALDFGEMQGTLYYGLIDYREHPHPLPVYFKKALPIVDGKVEVNIAKLAGKYDLSGWEKVGQGDLGLRVVNERGQFIYDGQVAFVKTADGFSENIGFAETPSVNKVTDSSVVLGFETNQPGAAVIKLNGKIVARGSTQRHHEIVLEKLKPNTGYDYQVEVSVDGDKSLHNTRWGRFTTAPAPGSRTPFVFAYASDSRSGKGGGERDIFGVNAYVMKKVMAVSTANNAAFLQFSGDMINGRSNNIDEQRLQYRNWKHCLAPFTRQMPVYATMGNHEGLFHTFDDGSKVGINVDRFPFDTESAEVLFAQEFIMPENGPISEDGASYDPDLSSEGDFPPYSETVFSYTYDNVAMVVLNSNYLYSRSFKYWFAYKGASGSPLPGGGLHGYIMDQQIQWLEDTLDRYQGDDTIDHIFVTQHTPVFPNGGHKNDDMWYDGDNTPRPSIAGKPVATGIIEQRDKILSLMDRHDKVLAVLTGDEHNYARTVITPDTPIHSDKYRPDQPVLTRNLLQINNGAAGAPYYAQQKLPWSQGVKTFSTQHAVVLFHVNGKQVRLEVVDPDTLSQVD